MTAMWVCILWWNTIEKIRFTWEVAGGAREQCKTCAHASTYNFVMQNPDFSSNG